MKVKITFLIAALLFFGGVMAQEQGFKYEPISEQSKSVDHPKGSDGRQFDKKANEIPNFVDDADGKTPEDAFKYDQVLPPNQIPDHQPECENYLLDVMFEDNAMVRLRNGELTDLRTNSTAGMQPILDQLAWFEWTRFSEVPEEFLDSLCENGSRSSGQDIYNLNNIYRLKVPEQKNIWELSSSLESLPGIIYARPVPKPAQLPNPPSYQDLQGYLNPASDVPSGINAEYAWTKTGGTGSNIKICDLEYSWNYNHADVTKALGSQINSNVADPYNSNHHGTAVIGVLVSDNNGWGTTGATYNSLLRTCGTYYGSPSPSYNPAGAITLSIANLMAGDIILLEQQSDYTGYDGYVPIEWYGNYSPNPQTNNPVYAAIVNAVANGIHVVEAGGNGNVNTGNLTWYGNSGAVIVGAGGGYAADNLRKLDFSSYGPRFDVQGWGENVMTTGYGYYYSLEGLNYYYRADFNGTSSASPIVTSAIACFEGYWKSNVSGTPPTPSNMRAILKRHGRPQVNPADGLIGNRPDLKAMITGYMYCTASSITCDEYISRVQFGTIDNSSVCNNYVDYTSICSTDLPLNGTQPITVTNGHPYAADQCGIWVDWNRDGDFYDANETISVTGNPGYGPYTANIAPPAGQTQGTCRVRVRITYTGVVDPCGTTNYGEVEDYTLNITSPVDNIWTGVVSNNWNDPANWNLLHVPYPTDNTVIPDGTPYECWIWTANAECKNMTIAAGTYLRNYDKTLTINENLSINGQLMMDNSTSSAITQINGNINWNSGSTAWTADATIIKVAGNWNFYAGANAQLAGGVMFNGSTNSFVLSQDADCSFLRFGNYKPAGNWVSISVSSTASLTINDSFYNQADAVTYIYSSYPVIIKGEFYNNGHLYCGAGTVVFDGVSHGVEMNTGDYFNNLTVSSSGNVNLNTDVDVNGNILIESGALYAVGRTINVGGNWTNLVGTLGFLEGASRVIFDGTAHNLIKSNETFNILEAKMGAALRIEDPAGFTVTCNQYDWTTGGIDVIKGTFTALDLYDNGIYGGYWLNDGGIINLTNSDGWIDLNANLNIYGGTFNVNGGTANSDWPYSANASITMSGGILDFKDRGIRVYSTAVYTLTENITGGTIRTVGGFENQRSDFTPTGNTIEMYGSTDAYLTTSVGCGVYNVVINKGADDDGATSTELFDKEGKPIPQTRASTAFAGSSPVTILGNLNINSGTFDMNTRTVNVTNTVNINAATLKMISASDNLTAYIINWNSGSNDNVTNGVFHINDWGFWDGTNAQLGASNTAYVKFLYFPTDSDAEFGSLVAKSYSKTLSEKGRAYYSVKVAGNFTLQSTVYWDNVAVDIIVAGNSVIENGGTMVFVSGADYYASGNLTLAGTIILGSGSAVNLNGDFIFPNTGILNVGQGTFTNNYSTGLASLSGALLLTTGTVEFPNRGVSISNTFNDQISGGIFRVGKTFAANTAGTFQPLAGTMEFINVSSGNYVQVTNGNYFYNMVLNKPGSSFQVYDNLIIKGSMFIDNGVLNSNNKTISIAENWYNNVGSAAFAETNSRVIFNGTGNQFCSTEDFYILEVNESSGLLYNLAGHNITCQVYDWTNGGIWIAPGNFSAADLADDGLFGTFAIYDGTMDLHQDIGQYVDLNGNIYVGAGGTLNVYGGNGESWWPYVGNANVTMNGGVLDFKDVGIYVNPSLSYSFTENISAGIIRTPGSFSANNGAFTPLGGSVELYGNLNTGIYNNYGSNFYNVIINKSLASDGNPVNYIDREGKSVTLTRGDNVVMSGDVLVNGTLTVNSGKLYAGNTGNDLTCMGSVNIENAATLELGQSSKLLLNSALTIKNGGTFRSTGTLGNEVLVTRVGVPRYSFTAQSGGNISADYTIFEFMGASGINIASGAVVDPAQAFNQCTFREGLSGNTLLTINSSQDLVSTGAIFPANTWGGSKNVTKSVNAGYMTFSSYSGAFGGPYYENDPNNRIEWYTSVPTQSVSIPAGWSGLSSFIMPSVTNLPALFAPIAANLTILQTMAGVYYPAGSINTIGPWASKSAYSVKLNAAATLPVSGLPEHNKSFALGAGWNLLPVICNTNVTTSTLVSGLGANLQIIKEIAGSKVYWPAFGIYTLNQLTPGKAYFVRMVAGGTVTFPNNVTDNTYIPDEPIKEFVTPWNDINRTAGSHIIGIDALALTDLQEGDILGVFTSTGLCVGNVQIGNISENQSIYAFADDQLTGETDGFTDGQPMIFKLFRPSTGEESVLEVVYSNEMPENDGLFVTEGISAISSISTTSTGIYENYGAGLYIYPNPTNNKVTIGGITGIEQILVMSSEGAVVMRFNPKNEGEQVLDLSGLPAGFYQVQIRTSEGVVSRKVVKG